MITRRMLLFTPAAFAQPAPSGLDLFLLTGQSNMAGRGEVEAQDRTPVDGVWALNKEMKWVPAADPLHWDRPTAGVGLGRSFALRMRAANPRRSIGLVPCAVGGSSLEQWTVGGAIFTEAVRRAAIASKAGTIRGILWHQGEAESGSAANAESYRERFSVVMSALRSETGAGGVPVAVGQLGTFFRRDEAARVNQQLAMLPLTFQRCAFVSSAGLVHKGDDVHFDSASLQEFGRRYALAYLSLDPDWEAK